MYRNGLFGLIILPPLVGGRPHSFNMINCASAHLLHLLLLLANHISQISYRHLDMEWGSRLRYNLLAQTNQYSFIINILLPQAVNKAVSLVPLMFFNDRNTPFTYHTQGSLKQALYLLHTL